MHMLALTPTRDRGVVVDTARAARSLAEGSKEAKHIFYARAHLCIEMQRVVTPLTKQTIGNPETVTFRNRNTEEL